MNVYMIMIQFAFFKIGFPILESHQEAFLEGVEFNIGGTVYSFNQWLGAISGGNIGEEPDLQGSQRKSLLVPKRPMLNPNPHISVDSDTSESFSSEHSSNVRTARTSLKSSPDYKRKTKRTSTKQEGISIADYRLYFATHFFWSQASVVDHFTSENIDEELNWMAFAFCENDTNVHINEKKELLHLSNIFCWHRKDFTSDNGSSDYELAKIVYNFLEGNKKIQL